VNKAGAGSSYGDVIGPWVGGTQGPNGAGGALPSVTAYRLMQANLAVLTYFYCICYVTEASDG
jgi:hypothetical protein